MKVCPKCGFIDRSMWRQNKWRTNVEFIKVEYEEDVPPEIMKAYNEKRSYAQDKNYGYRLCQRQKIIERVLIEEIQAYGSKAFHIPREKVQVEDPNQSRFSLENKETEDKNE